MRRRSLFQVFLIACAVLAGVSVAIHLVHNNFYVEPDSASYMSLAQNLAQGHGYLRYDGEWSADWPPLVPVSLIALSVFFRDPLQAFGALAALCYAGTILVAGRWLLSRVSWQASLAAVLLLLTALPLRKVMNSALSEPLFLLLTVSFLIQCMRYGKDASRWNLAGLAVLSALCCLTRYSGIVTIAVGGWYVWHSNNAQKISSPPLRAFRFCLDSGASAILVVPAQPPSGRRLDGRPLPRFRNVGAGTRLRPQCLRRLERRAGGARTPDGTGVFWAGYFCACERKSPSLSSRRGCSSAVSIWHFWSIPPLMLSSIRSTTASSRPSTSL